MPQAAGAGGDAVVPVAPLRWRRQSCKLTEQEYAQLSVLKQRAAGVVRPRKRGQLLRVGLPVLVAMSDDELVRVLDSTSLPAGD